jgi:FkbM family methyltransferase
MRSDVTGSPPAQRGGWSKSLTSVIKSAGRRLGIEVGPYRPAERRRVERLQQHGIAAVIDVGANIGQYGRALRTFGYDRPIISFEPLRDAFAALLAESSDDSAWECQNVALGDVDGEACIDVAANLASSSFLDLRPNYPLPDDLRVTRKERVAVRRHRSRPRFL